MKLVYFGGPFCDGQTFKRLLLVAEEIGFMDNPCVIFECNEGEWGTVKVPTPARTIDSQGAPVQVNALSPPGSEVGNKSATRDFFQRYAEADISNPAFKRIILEGLRDSGKFSSKLLSLDSEYRDGVTGDQIRSSLVATKELWTDALEPTMPSGLFYRVGSLAEIQDSLKRLIADVSIQVTSAMFVANETGHTPVTDDAYLSRLLTLRTSDARYLGQSIPATPRLGIEIAQAVVPDSILEKVDVGDVLEYRQKTADAYAAWMVQLNQIAATLDNLDINEIEEGIAATIVSDVIPRVAEYKNEMISVRDNLWGELLKNVAKWEMPSLAIGHVTGAGYFEALTLFAAATIRGVVQPVVDYLVSRRAAKRNHAISYLIGLTKLAGK